MLDTHTWLWWVGEPSRLGRAGTKALADADVIGIPAICCLEVAVAAARERIVLDRPVRAWLEDSLSLPRVELLPLTPRVAAQAADLQRFHGDPTDRLIVATAVVADARRVTRDTQIRRYKAVLSVW